MALRVLGYRRGKSFEIELLPIPGGRGKEQMALSKDAAQAFHKMYAAAKADGIDLVVNSAFRPHLKQTILYERYQHDLMAFNQGEGPKPSIVAKPGWSAHEAGDAVDINRAPGDNPKTPEADSPIDLWLKDNAHKYGFYRTVPSESWHWAYQPEKTLPLTTQR
jgi:LAS superfamily LD-carboxypeptidase LdcB